MYLLQLYLDTRYAAHLSKYVSPLGGVLRPSGSQSPRIQLEVGNT